jgi:hypothetical protein
MKTFTKIAVAIAVATLTTAAQAVQINGSISFAGGATLIPPGVATATQVDFGVGPNARVSAVSGDYLPVPAGIFGQTVTFTSFVFDPFAPLAVIWTFDHDGWTYAMSADTVTQLERSTSPAPAILNLKGSGIATITGAGANFDPTPGIWNVSVTEAGTSFSFAGASVVKGVPDGGLTLAMLGLALSGLALMRRKLS